MCIGSDKKERTNDDLERGKWPEHPRKGCVFECAFCFCFIASEVSVSEIKKDSPKSDAQECVREEREEHDGEDVEHVKEVYHVACMENASVQNKKRSIWVALDNVRSAYNVGAVFRTAEAIGVEKICLIGYTPRPIDRFGRPQPEIEKTALGAERLVPWGHYENATDFTLLMRDEGRTIVSVEQDARSVDYRAPILEEKIVLVFGNEVEGVSRELLDVSDKILAIPMYGKKESLNIAVSVGIVLYGLLDNN